MQRSIVAQLSCPVSIYAHPTHDGTSRTLPTVATSKIVTFGPGSRCLAGAVVVKDVGEGETVGGLAAGKKG